MVHGTEGTIFDESGAHEDHIAVVELGQFELVRCSTTRPWSRDAQDLLIVNGYVSIIDLGVVLLE